MCLNFAGESLSLDIWLCCEKSLSCLTMAMLVSLISQPWAANSPSILSQKQQTSPIKETEWRTGSNRQTALPTTKQDVVCLLPWVENNNGQLSQRTLLPRHTRTQSDVSERLQMLVWKFSRAANLIARGLATPNKYYNDRLKFAASNNCFR